MQERGPQGTKWKNSSGMWCWMATRGWCMQAPQRLAHVPSSRKPSKGIVAIPRKAWEWFGSLHQSHVSDHLIGFPPLPPPLVPSPSTPPPFDRAFLPVWPSTRYLWPSPRCLRTGWGLGECGGPLQRGSWPRECKRALP